MIFTRVKRAATRRTIAEVRDFSGSWVAEAMSVDAQKDLWRCAEPATDEKEGKGVGC